MLPHPRPTMLGQAMKKENTGKGVNLRRERQVGILLQLLEMFGGVLFPGQKQHYNQLQVWAKAVPSLKRRTQRSQGAGNWHLGTL